MTAISAGDSHTCAIADGKAYCWGESTSGRLGTDKNRPTRVPSAVLAPAAA
ncbi:MAG: hypothetical protein ACNA8R_15785 [Nitriliruptoraceae bacterium]